MTNMQTIDIDELRQKAKSGEYNEEAIANEFLKQVVDKEDCPIDIQSTLRNMGFVIEFKPLIDNLSGYVIVVNNDKKIIFINNSDDQKHQKFVLAHELGQFIYDFNSKTYINAYEKDARKDDCEIRANQFAANLLMPKKLFKKQYKKLKGNIKELSDYFGVLEKSIDLRMRELNLV